MDYDILNTIPTTGRPHSIYMCTDKMHANGRRQTDGCIECSNTYTIRTYALSIIDNY